MDNFRACRQSPIDPQFLRLHPPGSYPSISGSCGKGGIMNRCIPYIAGAGFSLALMSAENLVDRLCDTEPMQGAIPYLIESISSMLIP